MGLAHDVIGEDKDKMTPPNLQVYDLLEYQNSRRQLEHEDISGEAGSKSERCDIEMEEL